MKSIILICKCDIEGQIKINTGLTGPWDDNYPDGVANPRYPGKASLNKNKSYYCFDEGSKTIKICGEDYYYRVRKEKLYDFFYTELEVRKLKIEKLNKIKL